MSSREALLDEVYTLRSLGQKRVELLQEALAEIEELQKLLALAEVRIEELQTELDTATETKEPPHA